MESEATEKLIEGLIQSAFPLTVFSLLLLGLVTIALVSLIKRVRIELIRKHAKCEWRLSLMVTVGIGALAVAEQSVGGSDTSVRAVLAGLKNDLQRAVRGPQTPDEMAELQRFADGEIA